VTLANNVNSIKGRAKSIYAPFKGELLYVCNACLISFSRLTEAFKTHNLGALPMPESKRAKVAV
jgi:hypothetical protein